jgi:peroxidase
MSLLSPKTLKLPAPERRTRLNLETLEERLVLSAGFFRTINGFGNNALNPTYGEAETELIRLAGNAYEDGRNEPRGGFEQDVLPSARLISNEVHAFDDPGNTNDTPGIDSAIGLTGWVFQWGQFVDHDIGLSEPNPPLVGGDIVGNEPFDIAVPSGDPDFDPFNTGTVTIGLNRSNALRFPKSPTKAREQINELTAFLDGSNVYGSDDQRAMNLRTGWGGLLRTTSGGPDGPLLPFNSASFVGGFEENANALGASPETLFVAGDVRANEQMALTATHTLFVREHNRLAGQIATANPGMTDEEIYQEARRMVGAEIQAITYREFLPAVLGPGALPEYTGYDSSVNPQLSNEFSGAAFRVGHTMLPRELLRLNEDGSTIGDGNLALRDAFFAPDEISNVGIEPYLRGLAAQTEQEIDRFVVEDARSFLFGPPGSGGLDLAALNIQRGRDHGLPAFNDVRVALGLSPATSYADISADPATQAALEAAYGVGNVDDVDLWTGGLAEDHAPGSQLGETFHVIWVDQFTRMRDGDSFYYENCFSGAELAELQNTTLADIIRRNTGIDNIQDEVLRSPETLVIRAEEGTGPAAITVQVTGNHVFVYLANQLVEDVNLTSITTVVVYGTAENDDITLELNNANADLRFEVDGFGGEDSLTVATKKNADVDVDGNIIQTNDITIIFGAITDLDLKKLGQ